MALAGSLSSGLGSAVQFLLLRWALGARQPWMARFAPGRARLEGALERYPSASFMAIALARATPLPDAPLKLVAAAAAYPVARYFLAVVLGALPYYFALALLGRWVRIPAWILVVAAGAIALAVVADRVRRRARRDP